MASQPVFVTSRQKSYRGIHSFPPTLLFPFQPGCWTTNSWCKYIHASRLRSDFRTTWSHMKLHFVITGDTKSTHRNNDTSPFLTSASCCGRKGDQNTGSAVTATPSCCLLSSPLCVLLNTSSDAAQRTLWRALPRQKGRLMMGNG